MVTYFYAWTPFALVFATAAILSNFFFAMLALVFLLPVVLVALVALAGAIVAAPYFIGRSILRRWHETGARQPSTAALIPAERHHA